jgi:hypothetical protein
VSLIFTPDNGKVMSYFFCKGPMTFSPGQVKTIRGNLLDDPGRRYLLCDEATAQGSGAMPVAVPSRSGDEAARSDDGVAAGAALPS